MASRRTTSDYREYFNSELAKAISDIRAEYDQVSNANRQDMETWYKMRVQEVQTQLNKQTPDQNYTVEELEKVRAQIKDLDGKLAQLEAKNALLEKQTEELNYQLEDDHRSHEAALSDRDVQIRKMDEERRALALQVQSLFDTKQTLDTEIAIYRKLLEGEENRPGLRQVAEQAITTSHPEKSETTKVPEEEAKSRTSFQRSAKGNVSIVEASPEGKFVILENSHRSKEEPIGEWKLKRKVDGKQEITYTLPSGFILKPGKTVKVWGRDQGGTHNPPEELVFDGECSFGTGSNVQTVLFSKEGEERATYIQRSGN